MAVWSCCFSVKSLALRLVSDAGCWEESSIKLISILLSVYPVPLPLAMVHSKQACWVMAAIGIARARNYSLSSQSSWLQDTPFISHKGPQLSSSSPGGTQEFRSPGSEVTGRVT